MRDNNILTRHINSSNNSAGSAFINATLQVTTTAEVYEQDLPESQFKAVEKLNTLVVIENGSGTVTGQRDFCDARKRFRMWWPGTESNRRRQPFQGCGINHLQPSFLWLHRLTGV